MDSMEEKWVQTKQNQGKWIQRKSRFIDHGIRKKLELVENVAISQFGKVVLGNFVTPTKWERRSSDPTLWSAGNQKPITMVIVDETQSTIGVIKSEC